MAAVASASIYQACYKSTSKCFLRKNYIFPLINAGIAGGIVVTFGYFAIESTIFGYGIVAASSIPSNLLQNLFGTIVSILLMPVLSQVPVVRSISFNKSEKSSKSNV